MTQPPSAGDRVRVRHRADLVVDGVVWSDGPNHHTYWVIPDQPQPDMIQGCIRASLSQMEDTADDTLW